MSKEELHNCCVIGRQCHGRTWGTEDDTIEHAKQLLAKTARGTNERGPSRLFVVKVVQVVELQQPPMTVRPFVAKDLE